MPRPVKVGLSILVALGLLLVLAGGALFLLVDPNDYKPRISKLAERHTRRPLAIHGEIRLSLFPVTGLVTDGIVLSGPAGFDGPPLARAARLRVDVDPFSLIRGRLSITRLEIEGLEIHLVRLENGRTSWEGLPPKTGTDASEEGPLLPPALTVAGLAVKDGALTWSDHVRGRSFRVQDASLSLEDLSPGEPSDLALSFIGRSDRPGLEAETRVKGKLTLRRDGTGAFLEDLRLDLDARGSGLPGETARLELASEVEADWKKGSLQVNGLRGSLSGTEVRGWVHLEDLSSPVLSFDLSLGFVDLDTRFPTRRKEAGTPEPDPEAGPTAPPVLKRMEADGRLKVKRVRWAGLDVHDLDLHLVAEEGLLQADPVRARFSGGTLQGNARLDLRGPDALTGLRLRADGVEVGPVSRALAGRREMTGRAKLDIDLASTGLDPAGWPAGLNGRAAFQILDGTVGFFGVPQDATERAGERVNPFEETGRPTPFERIDGTLQARQGVVANRDLRFRSQVLSAAGDGVVDLRKQRVGYDLAVVLPLLPDVWVRVAGPLHDPGVQVQPLKMLTKSVKGLGKEALDLPGSIGRGARSLGEGVTELPGSIGDTIKGLFD